MISSNRICVVATVLGLHVASVHSFGFSGSAGIPLQRAHPLRASTVHAHVQRVQEMPANRMAPMMLAMDNEAARATIIMENQAQSAIAQRNSRDSLAAAVSPAVSNGFVQYLMVCALLARTIIGLMYDAVVATPRAVKDLAAAAFNSHRLDAARNKALVIYTAAAELSYDIVEEFAWRFAFFVRFGLSTWAAFNLRAEQSKDKILQKIQKVEDKIERFGYAVRRNSFSRRRSITALGAHRHTE